jgi:hypothetical protein
MTPMNKLFLNVVVLSIPGLAAAQIPADMMAQLPANPVSQTARIMMEEHVHNIVAGAELMPADKYGFHPTEAQMTFGALIAHIVQTNEFMCAAIAGTITAPPKVPTGKDPKDVLVNALKASVDRCTAALSNVTDAQVGEMFSMGPQKLPRIFFMMGIVADWADHYSTEASYLRLNNILPPSAHQPGR